MPRYGAQDYISPLMSRIKENERLSLETLARYVPPVQEAFAAQDEIKGNPDITDARKRELRRVIARGESAKERLVLIALPLIKSLAHKEYTRRQKWNSRVSLEDIMSEGMSGLMRGIRAYNPEGKHTSPTNYLGQWILTDMRRNTESLDHDFAIPFEAMERQRKIRAVRSRLHSTLGREPTDEEIIEAAADTAYAGNNMMGRADKSAEDSKPSRRRVITQKHIDEEREMYTRTGALRGSTIISDGEEYTLADEASAQSVTGAQSEITHRPEDSTAVDQKYARESMGRLIEDAFSLMAIGQTQQEVIRRRFGLPPYEEDETIKNIVVNTGIPKYKVNRILTAFAKEMSTPNTHFHYLVDRTGADEMESMGLLWVVSALGSFTPPIVPTTSRDLKDSIRKPTSTPARQPQITASTTGSRGIIATFLCSYEEWEYTGVYMQEENVPLVRTCPRCMQQGSRVN